MKDVLIVEDDLIIALSTQKMVQQLGYTIVGRVTTGEDAVNQALSKNPDIILMDVRLAGEMDGIEASARILKNLPHTTIIYLSGNTDQTYLERAKKTGYKAFLVKPVNTSDLKNNLG